MLSISRFVRLSVRVFVCLSVRLFTFEVPFKRLYGPTIFRDSESLGKSNGKKWSQWSKIAKRKELFFWLILPYKTWWKPRFPMD